MFNLKTAAVCAVLSAGCLVGVGCKGMGGGDSSSSMAGMSGMSKDQLMTQGQQMISQGQTMQTNASAVPDGGSQDGMSKDDMMTKAKELIQKGEAMLEKAKSM